MSRIDIGEIQAFLYQLRAANESGRKTIQSIKMASEPLQPIFENELNVLAMFL
ncbi:hypothetical protein HED71_000146 [Listeria monocytogenes]|nr:hypothetical protein [Listeria monocytogenes]